MEIPPKLKEYIDNNRDSLPPLTDPDEPLQIDSLRVVRLVAFLENDLGYRIEDEELIAENFATLRSLGELLATKTPNATNLNRSAAPGQQFTRAPIKPTASLMLRLLCRAVSRPVCW